MKLLDIKNDNKKNILYKIIYNPCYICNDITIFTEQIYSTILKRYLYVCEDCIIIHHI